VSLSTGIDLCKIGLVFLLFTGCAFDLAHVDFQSVQIQTPVANRLVTLGEAVHLNNMPCGYSRKLHKGTTWRRIGIIEQGEVYKSLDQTLTLECSNIFEAYLVIQINQLTGFYLPVQDGFVPLKKPVELHLN